MWLEKKKKKIEKREKRGEMAAEESVGRKKGRATSASSSENA